MKDLKKIAFLLLAGLFLGACGSEVTKEEIHELPRFTASYYHSALEALNDKAESSPENADVYFKKGEVLERLGNAENAIINYKKAIKLDSLNPTYYKSLARLFTRQDKLGRAEENALKAEQLGDQTADLHQLLADISIRRGAYNMALNHLNRAIEKAPGNSGYVFRKGKIYLQLGDTARAKSYLLNNQDRMEAGAEIYETLADIYSSEKKYPEAIAYLDSSLVLLKGFNKELLIKKATVLNKSGQTSAAKMLLSEHLKEDSTNFALNFKMAELHFDSYDYDSSLYYLNNTLLADSKSKESFLLMGKVYDRKHLYYTAQDQFKNALLIDTSYQEAKTALQELDRKLAYIRMRKAEAEKNKLPDLQAVKPGIKNK